MAPSEKKTKNQYGYDKKSKTRYSHKDCIFSSKSANKTPSKSKNQVMDSDFCFFCKKTIDKTFYSIDNISSFHILLHSVVAVVWKAYMAHIGTKKSVTPRKK